MSRKRWIWIGALALAALLLGGAGWSLRDDLAYARLATGFAAKQTCSCLHVSGRSLESCLGDFPEDARRQISVAQDGDRVRASVLLGAIGAEAEYEGEFGCRILD